MHLKEKQLKLFGSALSDAANGGGAQANRAYVINTFKDFALDPTWCTDIMLSLLYLEYTTWPTFLLESKSQDFRLRGASVNCCVIHCSVCKRLSCSPLVLRTLLFRLRKPFSPYETLYLVLATENYTHKHSYSSKLLLSIFSSTVAVFPTVVKEDCGKGTTAQIQASPSDKSLAAKTKSLRGESENKIVANTTRMTFLAIM